ncbi:mannose-1-phosphate guanylyltransferase [Halorubellus sp. JP-L1]|uniref:mannose-1-phosphate guanylyltransferase n=1 Tax=Halorubellus sp. JP-L1 TaxID=2715753 RepID=UPI00140AFAF2|nr:mannose-1-phosphate guanylyltransferase [Halorubellus sp. JP-L1]
MVTTVACVLAGGTGTRLYPASRSDRPKQFLSLDGDRSLLAETVDRVAFADETVVLTGDAHADHVREHAPGADVFVEPTPKDTGPALAYAARRVRETFGDCVLLSVPADHHVDGDFAAAARHAAAVAVETEGLVTMGVEPTRDATGYGYVEPTAFEPLAGDADATDGTDATEATDATDGTEANDATGEYAPVAAFREKPDRETARQLRDLGCLWNAGIFAWTPDAFLRECRGTPLESLADDELALDAAFDAAPAVSVDYAVLERTDSAYVVPAAFEWDDLGSWDALGRILDGDDAGNAVLATEGGSDAGDSGDAVLVDTEDAVVATDDKHVSVVEGDGLVVAAFDDRVLVVPRESSQRVRAVVAELRERGLF